MAEETLRPITASVGLPSQASKTLEQALRRGQESIHHYPETRTVPSFQLADVFRLLHPRHPHDLPGDLELVVGYGTHGVFDLTIRALRYALDVFNAHAATQPGGTALKHGFLFPRPSFGEFHINLSYGAYKIIPLDLQSRDGWRPAPEAVVAALDNAHQDPSLLVLGMVHTSPSSPTGTVSMLDHKTALAKALRDTEAQRHRILERAAGGAEALGALQQRSPEFKRAWNLLSRLTIFEDLAYLGSERGDQITASFHEAYPAVHSISESVVSAGSLSKNLGAAGLRAGFGFTGNLYLAEGMRAFLHNATAGLNALPRAALEICFDRRHPLYAKHHSKIALYIANRAVRLHRNRLLAETLVNGDTQGPFERGDRKWLTDRMKLRGASRGIPGMSVLKGGASSIFRVLQFDPQHAPWQKMLGDAGIPSSLPLDARMHRFMKEQLKCELTPKSSMHWHGPEAVLRLHCDIPPEDMITLFARLREAEAHAARPAAIANVKQPDGLNR